MPRSIVTHGGGRPVENAACHDDNETNVTATIEFRFVGVDASGRWTEVRYAAFKSESAAKGYGSSLLREFPAVVLYRGDRQIGIWAQIA
jgi:hypothetical protein